MIRTGTQGEKCREILGYHQRKHVMKKLNNSKKKIQFHNTSTKYLLES